MQYHLDTIPVWDALRLGGPCPLCAMHFKEERLEVERTLGGAVMEPDERIRVNRTGFCQAHHQQLAAMSNKLGHSLLMDSHTLEILPKLEAAQKSIGSGGKAGLFRPAAGGGLDKAIALLEETSRGCIICDELSVHMARYLYTFTQLWKKDAKFRAEWEQSQGVCLPHAAELLRAAQQHLNAADQAEFAASVLSLTRKALDTDEQDLKWFTLKFDYRNQDKPWGNSKNALERTVNRLRGWCLGDEPVPKEK